jgi:quinol monooxygenase YgiN
MRDGSWGFGLAEEQLTMIGLEVSKVGKIEAMYTFSTLSRDEHKERIHMSVRFTLIVRFKVQETAKTELINQLKEVFGHIEREETFIEASLQQDREDPTSLLVYEVWRETPESILENQMTRKYRKGFEQAIVDLKVERTPSWYVSLAEWKKA